MLTAGPLTVKHIEEGRQSIIQALDIEFEAHVAASDNADGYEGPQVSAYGTPREKTLQYFRSGRVYVMNEAGATVGMYDLDMRAPDPR